MHLYVFVLESEKSSWCSVLNRAGSDSTRGPVLLQGAQTGAGAEPPAPLTLTTAGDISNYARGIWRRTIIFGKLTQRAGAYFYGVMPRRYSNGRGRSAHNILGLPIYAHTVWPRPIIFGMVSRWGKGVLQRDQTRSLSQATGVPSPQISGTCNMHPHRVTYRETKLCMKIKIDDRKIIIGSTTPSAIAKCYCDINAAYLP